MKSFIKILLLLIMCMHAAAQETEINKLKYQLNQHKVPDTFRVNRLNELATNTALSATEKEQLAAEAISISRKIKYTIGEGYALTNAGSALYLQGDTTKASLLLQQADSLARKTNNQQLSAYVIMYIGFGKYLNGDNSAIDYLLKAEQVAAQTGNKYLLLKCQTSIAQVYQIDLTNYPKAMEYALKAVRLGEEVNSSEAIARAQNVIGAIYAVMGNNADALIAYKKAEAENKKLGNKNLESILQNNIGEVYRLIAKYPEAITAYKKAMEYDTTIASIGTSESNLADVYVRMDSLPLAFYYGFRSLKIFKQLDDPSFQAWICGILARAYLKQHKPDSAIYSAALGFDLAKETGTIEFMRDNTEALSKAYAVKKDFEKAYTYHLQSIIYRDSMVNEAIRNNAAIQQYNYNLEKKQSEITVLSQQKKIQHNFLLSSLIVLLLIFITAILLLRNNRHKQKANELLQVQKKELEVERDKTSKAMTELQQTQKQLIQSEKMASLGELTAGIAHEIQNPLNFVNNFSEVNREMLEELKVERSKPNGEKDTSLEDDLINDIIANEEKINHHGKRADAIVKGMLQHSRTNTGKAEPTDINKLCDEYLRLSYHGLRAKDKNFNADFKTDFDESVGKINIVPQDMGRVLLNLFNNAFYAVNERQKAESIKANAEYKPLVSVRTRRLNSPSGDGGVEIIVSDNGNGIPQNIVDKIFQPFFTTKPTGEGTGLGLSLSYDIIKAHGGKIKVETKQEAGTAFIISFPLTF